MQKQEPARENKRHEIEPTRVIPNDVRVFDRAGRSRTLWNESEAAENEIDDNSRENHRSVEDCGNPGGRSDAVILRVNADNRDNDQVCVNKRNHAAETDAVRPKQTSERNVSNGTNERNHGNDGANQRVLDRANNGWSAFEKQRFPPIMRHERR